MSLAKLFVPSQTIPPSFVQENPRQQQMSPTTWPLSFTATAELVGPAGVPRSTIPPAGVHENARYSPLPGVKALQPTTWPLLLTAAALLLLPPRVPRSTAR